VAIAVGASVAIAVGASVATTVGASVAAGEVGLGAAPPAQADSTRLASMILTIKNLYLFIFFLLLIEYDWISHLNRDETRGLEGDLLPGIMVESGLNVFIGF
jgi:hypothetical protein